MIACDEVLASNFCVPLTLFNIYVYVHSCLQGSFEGERKRRERERERRKKEERERFK